MQLGVSNWENLRHYHMLVMVNVFIIKRKYPKVLKYWDT